MKMTRVILYGLMAFTACSPPTAGKRFYNTWTDEVETYNSFDVFLYWALGIATVAWLVHLWRRDSDK